MMDAFEGHLLKEDVQWLVKKVGILSTELSTTRDFLRREFGSKYDLFVEEMMEKAKEFTGTVEGEAPQKVMSAGMAGRDVIPKTLVEEEGEDSGEINKEFLIIKQEIEELPNDTAFDFEGGDSTTTTMSSLIVRFGVEDDLSSATTDHNDKEKMTEEQQKSKKSSRKRWRRRKEKGHNDEIRDTGDGGSDEEESSDLDELDPHPDYEEGIGGMSSDEAEDDSSREPALLENQRHHSSLSRDNNDGDRKTESCSICHKKFTTKQSRQVHEFVHSGRRPFSCETCGRSFSRKDSLQRHEEIHTGKKPFQCNNCGGRFSLKQHLKRHQEIHTGTKRFQCKKCGRRFSRESSLKMHLTKKVCQTKNTLPEIDYGSINLDRQGILPYPWTQLKF